MSQVNIEVLRDYEKKKLITCREHPNGRLLIWNYTPMVQFDKIWDEITLQCRGLITDTEGNIVARPFTKFFNYGEYKGELGEFHHVTEKYDGSLGILYWDGDGFSIATRGSFTSDQAIMGSRMLFKHVKHHGHSWIDPNYTYLFEIIYPENRIVVNYGDTKKLVLLAKIHIETGEEVEIFDVDFPHKADFYGWQTVEELIEHNRENSEGYVIRFKDGLRLKVKFEEYVRLHRLFCRTQPKDIWEILSRGESLDEFLKDVPDEFYEWVHQVQNRLLREFRGIYIEASEVYAQIKFMRTRKEQALAIVNDDPCIRPVVFALLDGDIKKAEDRIWRWLKPKFEKPFKEDIDG